MSKAVARHFHWRLPALHARACQYANGGRVIEIECGTGNEGQAGSDKTLQCALVVGLDDKLAVVAQLAQIAQVSLGFDQGLTGEYYLLATLGQLAADAEPVVEFHVAAARADRF